MPEFKVGDVVRLKCGGPAMVVESVHDVNVVVVYHTASGIFERVVAKAVLVHSDTNPITVKN